MPVASILVNGQPGDNRTLDVGVVVNLANDVAGDETTHEWQIIGETGKGAGNEASLATPNSPSTTLTMPIEGSVKVQLVVDRNMGTQQIDTVICGYPDPITGKVTPAPGEGDPSKDDPWLRDIGTTWRRSLGGYTGGVVVRSQNAGPGQPVMATGTDVITPGSPSEYRVLTVDRATAAIQATRPGGVGPFGIFVGPVVGSTENLSMATFQGPVRGCTVPSPVEGGLVMITPTGDLAMDDGTPTNPLVGLVGAIESGDQCTVYVTPLSRTASVFPASAVQVATLPDWADGEQMTADNLQAILDRILSLLAGAGEDGAARIRALTRAGSPDSLSAENVGSQLAALLVLANARGRLATANTWADTQTIDPTSLTDPMIRGRSAASGRRLIYEIPSGQFPARLYFDGEALEFVLNASWDGAQWVKDQAGFFSGMLRVTRSSFSFHNKLTSPTTWPDGDWSAQGRSFEWVATGLTTGTTVSHSRDRVVPDGPMTGQCGIQYTGSGGGSIGASSSYSSGRLASAPASVTFVVLSSFNVDATPSAWVLTQDGAGFFDGTTGSGSRYLHVKYTAT